MQLSYDELCQNKLLAFTIFSKVKAPQQLIEQGDTAEFKLALQEHRSRVSTTLYCSVLSTFTFCLILKIRNPIYALTARSSFFGILKKYYFIPVLLAQPFQKQNRQLYDDKVNKILKKYDFTSSDFQEAFKQIEANGGIKKFMKKYITEKDEELQQPTQQTQQ
ncbi:unnamed protein product [Paramecium sonneborni]|uniref:Uncharacterized protein n=1 Tax=Paramecium sonneborni TaxID=65129 RepID=A0A8S1M070_9CILI|nr:unnamed protein product [Paramecium sonneborni]